MSLGFCRIVVRKRVPAFLLAALMATGGIAPKLLFAQTAAELPRAYVDTTLVAPTGRTIAVNAGDNLQAALDAAVPGDVITLQAGATFVGPFTLPKKTGSGWITVRTSAPDSALPPPGTRITPAYSAVMPKLITRAAAPIISTAPGAHHYRFIGVEFTAADSLTFTWILIVFGDDRIRQTRMEQVPHHLIVDRCYIHGHSSLRAYRGIMLNSASTAIVDSYISQIHSDGEAQAIGGWNGPGPYKIVNNFLEGAGENIMFGGADAAGPEFVPADIEIRRNHIFKPLTWQIGHPTYAGIPWTVKNSLELKLAKRVLIEGNIFENSWAHAQDGIAIVLTVRNQEGTNPYAVVEDVTFQHNVITNATGGIIILGRDYLHPSLQASRLTIRNNLFQNVSGGRLFQITEPSADVVIEHNTHIGPPPIHMLAVATRGHTGFVYRNNVTMHGQFGFLGDATSAAGGTTVIAELMPGGVFAGNVIGMDGAGSGITAQWATPRYPSGNFFIPSLANAQVLGSGALAASSPFKGRGTDGQDPGIDLAALTAALQQDAPSSPPPPTMPSTPIVMPDPLPPVVPEVLVTPPTTPTPPVTPPTTRTPPATPPTTPAPPATPPSTPTPPVTPPAPIVTPELPATPPTTRTPPATPRAPVVIPQAPAAPPAPSAPPPAGAPAGGSSAVVPKPSVETAVVRAAVETAPPSAAASSPRVGFVDRLYAALLGRTGASTEVAGHVTAGGATEVSRAFLESREYRGVPVSAPEHVTRLYQAFLGREPTPSERDAWVPAVYDTLSSLVPLFVQSPEFASLISLATGLPTDQLVRALYTHLLGREAGPEEVAGWVTFVNLTGDWQGVVRAFLTSPEYARSPQSIWELVSALYRSLLLREPSQAEKDAWNEYLVTQLRGVHDGFTGTPEAQARFQATPPAETKMKNAGEKVKRAADNVEKNAEKAGDKTSK